jgi:hypothetical protein
MRGVGSDVAARAIIASCRNQFPTTAPVETRQDGSVAAPAAPAPGQNPPAAQPVEATQRPEQTAPGTSRSLTSGELQNLKSSAFILADSYRVTIQNNNEHVTVTEVTVAVWNASKPDERRSYTLPVPSKMWIPTRTTIRRGAMARNTSGASLPGLVASRPRVGWPLRGAGCGCEAAAEDALKLFGLQSILTR